MSITGLVVEMTARTAELEAAIRGVQETLAARLLPVVEETVRWLREWYASYPGMPYTAPSLWDADQMIADRGDR